MVDITVAKPFYSVLVLAFVCSALVAGAAVGLRPLQEENRRLDRQKNILYAAGLYRPDIPVEQLFADIETRLVDLESGQFIEPGQLGTDDYNQRKAPLTEDFGRRIPADEDVAKLGYQEKYSYVYLLRDSGIISQVILPVRGKGLWSTMYAYVAIAGDLSTIRGISFYEHGETPGLGGEIENRQWQEGWSGKQIYDDGQVALRLVKGGADPGPGAQYQIDGLSGATLTSDGVEEMMAFWFGEHGFKPFLNQLRQTGEVAGNG